jgi:mannose-6-phosphate isomerase-like protein (cupin superfamily)
MIEIIDWKKAIEGCQYDEKVGIRIAKLTTYGDQFSTFITMIDPGKHVTPHYHKHGDEHYHIISGIGKLELKNIINGNKKTYNISPGQSFAIPQNTLHQLINTGQETLVLMFSCEMAHLETDRHFI